MLIFLEVFANESEPVVDAESADGLDERERSSTVLEAPRPPNSLLSISAPVRPLGLRFPPTLRGKPLQGKKNITKQMQRAAGQCVCKCVCVCYTFACLWILKTAHACGCICVCLLCVSLSEGQSCICVYVCVFLYYL